MSKNHQFTELSEVVVKRYTKTVPYIISGRRLNPHNPTLKIDFVLKTAAKDFNFETKKVISFDYEEEVIELYSENEVKYFLKVNKYLIDQGLIKEYFGANPTEIARDNFLNDSDIEEIARSKNANILKSKVRTITSIVTLERIKTAAVNQNRTVGMIKVIDSRIQELS